MRPTPGRGVLDPISEAVRDQRATLIDRVWVDVRAATRRLRCEPGLAVASVATIGLAVGLMTAVYSVASAVLLRPLPFADPDRLVAIWRTLALAAVGLYGVLANLVGQRIREIGLRMALGASRRQAAWLIARQATALVGSGVAIGLAIALGASRLIRSFLFEVSPLDPLTLAAALLLLLAVAAAATLPPALRASRIDPMTALRYE